MKEKRIITKEMVDYVESHRDGEIRYDKSFVIKEGEECIVDGVSSYKESLFKVSFADGRCCYLPVDLFDIDPIEYSSRLEMDKKREEYNKKVDWNSIRTKAAIHILGGMVAERCYRADEEDGENELKNQARTVKRCAYTAVKYADALIKELQKHDVL